MHLCDQVLFASEENPFGMMSSPPEIEPLASAIGLLVPEIEPLVGPWRAKYDPAASQGVGAHITLLFPFKPAELITNEVIADLVSFFARQRLPRLEFAGVCAFPNALYLPPEPQSAVQTIIAGLAERYPETPPYGGTIPVADVIPHLTVAYAENPNDLLPITEAFCRASVGLLPIYSHVSEALLLVQDEERMYRTRAVLPFKV
jgi:2'-5' RNA ligase